MATVPALILAGGLGTRLRAVAPNIPKPMVLVNHKPFLYWLVRSLRSVGFQRVILSIGYLAEVIERYPWNDIFPGVEFEFVREENPLGTGGAVQTVFQKLPALRGAWVVNGDTILEYPLRNEASLDEAHYTALAGLEVFDAVPNLETAGDRVVAVREGLATYFDGGQAYVSRFAVEKYAGSIPCSFHKLIEQSIEAKRVGFTVTPGTCFDIGTPDRLKRFENYLNINNIY